MGAIENFMNAQENMKKEDVTGYLCNYTTVVCLCLPTKLNEKLNFGPRKIYVQVMNNFLVYNRGVHCKISTECITHGKDVKMAVYACKVIIHSLPKSY